MPFPSFKGAFNTKGILQSFIAKAVVLYLLWLSVYELYILPSTLADEWVISNLVFLSAKLMHLFADTIYYSTVDIEFQMVGIDGAHPVWIGAPCNGLSIIALFIIFIIAFPGPVKHKIWFIPAGILGIHAINVLRICALAFIQLKWTSALEFNHTYTFTIMVYAFIFMLWVIWVKKFASKKDVKN